MPEHISTIQKYQVFFRGMPPTEQSLPYPVVIHLFDEKDQYVGKIFFWQGDRPAEARDHYSDEYGLLVMFLSIEHYPRVIDLLRNESPLSFFFSDDTAYLATGKEPSGEGEGEPY